MQTTPSRAWITALPKAEIHTHLESFADETLRDLAIAAGETPPAPGYKPTGLTELLDFLDWSCGLVRDRPAAVRIGREFVQRAQASGVRTVDVILNPSHWGPWQERLGELLDALDEGFAAAEADGGPATRVCLSILRYWDLDKALALVDLMAELRHPRVVALSIDGNEEVAGRTSERFKPAFDRARELGFRLTAHAGESSPAWGVWDVLDVLGVERVDHGFRAITDERLVERLARDAIPLGLCPSQNLMLGWAPRIEEHPMRTLFERGVRMSINTDSSFSYVLTDEYLMCARAFGWEERDLGAIARTSIEASFAPDRLKSALLSELDAYLIEE